MEEEVRRILRAAVSAPDRLGDLALSTLGRHGVELEIPPREVSEPTRPGPDRRVVEWMNETASSSLFVSSITIAEVHFGLELLPQGRRRTDLQSRFEQFLSRGFDQRIVSFDVPAARIYGTLMAHRRRAGTPLASLDGQIASIARVHGFAVATRNTDHFADCGVELVNPFVTS